MGDESNEISKALVNVRKLPTIQIVSGDITKIDADCIITPINSRKNWDGGIDRAIYAVAGEMYHDQIRKTHLENLFSGCASKPLPARDLKDCLLLSASQRATNIFSHLALHAQRPV